MALSSLFISARCADHSPGLIEENNPLLSGFGRQLLGALYEELCALEQRIAAMEERIQQIHRSNALCQKIAAVEGVGPVIATAVVAAIADGRAFHNGRQFAAWIGLVEAPFRDHQPRRSLPAHALDSWRKICSLPRTSQGGQSQPVDR